MVDGVLRQPRAWLTVNGASLPVLEAQATVHRYQSADTFSATLAMDAPGVDIGALATACPIPAALLASNGDGSGSVVLVKGAVDQVELQFDSEHDRQLRLSGRDRTAELLDKQSKEKWQDRTASDIVGDIAGRHGFAVQIDGTQDRAGKQYVYQHDFISDLESEWSVVVALAEREGKVAYVKGDTLYFVKPGNTDAQGGVLAIRYTPPSRGSHAAGNFLELHCTRNVPQARPVKVNVRSFDRRQKKVVTGTKQAAGTGGPVEVNHSVPGLTQAEADAVAEKKLNENTAFEKTIQLRAPGDVNADPRMMLSVSGTQTAFDQTYFIDSIEHRFTLDGGYDMTIHAKNKSPGR